MFINPFEYVDKKNVKNRVEKLKKKKKNMTPEDMCRLLVEKKSRWCAAAGAVSSVPASVPVLGTLAAAVLGTAFDVVAMGYFMAELVLEVAACYNRRLDIPGTSREAVWVLASAVGAGAAGKGLAKAATAGLSGTAFTRLLQQMLLAMGIRATQRTVLRIIPFAGMLATGAVNYYTCKKLGSFIVDYYSRHVYDEAWDGKTIEVQGEIADD